MLLTSSPPRRRGPGASVGAPALDSRFRENDDNALVRPSAREELMDFGIGIATSSDSWKTALRAEALGFSHAWFYDTQMITADCFVAMGAAALKTSRVRLGTG